MKVLRTPGQRFVDLPGYPFAPNFVEIDGLRIHYVDEGTGDDEVVLMLHGEPSWSYLYRKMIPPITTAGFRAIAPDLIGFGKSDKPAERSAYTYQKHIDWMASFLRTLDLQNITLVCQDWGGLIGLRLAVKHEARFKRIVVANTFLPTGHHKFPETFLKWQHYSQTTETFNIGRIVNGGCVSDLPAEIMAAYDAPFPDESYKAGARQFPAIVPMTPDDPQAVQNGKAWQVLRKWRKPFLTAFSDSDVMFRGGDWAFRENIPGARGQNHTTIEGAGHFLQEDKGEVLAQVVIDFITRT